MKKRKQEGPPPTTTPTTKIRFFFPLVQEWTLPYCPRHTARTGNDPIPATARSDPASQIKKPSLSLKMRSQHRRHWLERSRNDDPFEPQSCPLSVDIYLPHVHILILPPHVTLGCISSPCLPSSPCCVRIYTRHHRYLHEARARYR